MHGLPVNVFRPVFFILAIVLGLAAADAAAQNSAQLLPVHPDPVVIATDGDPARFTVEVAATPKHRQVGLMFRESMPRGHGMLFVFDSTRQVSMWMSNTYIPLDMVFIGENGRIGAIRRAEPRSLDLIAPQMATRFVLELNAGTAEAAGIEVGARVHHPLIDAIAGTK